MTSVLNAKIVIGPERNPEDDGIALARRVAASTDQSLPEAIDISGLVPEDLVSSFVNSFLLYLEQQGIDVEEAGRVKWIARFPSEKERMERLVSYYLEDYRARQKAE